MADFGTIAAVLNNIKVATDIAKAIRESDHSIERAELKLKLAEMISALADAKIEVTDVQQLISEKERQIAELEEAFQTKDALVKRFDAYYHVDSDGAPTGEPFCMSCWQVKHKKFNLQQLVSDRYVRVCVACGNQYSSRLAGIIVPGQDDV